MTKATPDAAILTGRNVLAINDLTQGNYRQYFNHTYVGTLKTDEPAHALFKFNRNYLLVVSDYLFEAGKPFPEFTEVKQVDIEAIKQQPFNRRYSLADLPVVECQEQLPRAAGSWLELANNAIPNEFAHTLPAHDQRSFVMPFGAHGMFVNFELYAKLYRVLKPLGAFSRHGAPLTPGAYPVFGARSGALCTCGEIDGGKFFVTVCCSKA